MKKLDLSQIVGTTGMPLKKGTLLHIVESQREVVDGLIRGLVSYTTGNVVILYGCAITGTNPGVISNTAGAVFYNGEVYLVDAQTFTTTGSNIPCWTIFETSVSGLGYDTVLLTDASIGYIHKDRKFKLVNGPIGGSGVSGYTADYNGSTVKFLNIPYSYSTSGITSTNSAPANGIVVSSFSQKRIGESAFISGLVTVTIASADANVLIRISPKFLSFDVGHIGIAILETQARRFLGAGTLYTLSDGTIGVSCYRNTGNPVVGDIYCLSFSASYPTYTL